MCGRAAQALPPEVIEEVFNVKGADALPLNWNVAPKQNVGVIRRHPENGERVISLLNWGLVPSWADQNHKYSTINAKAEELAQKPFFRDAWRAARRCLIPFTAFYEWKAAGKAPKQPFAIARSDGLPLAIAGLWEGKQLENGEVLRTFTIITTSANEVMEPLHHRMPVILDPSDWKLWLGEVENTLETIEALLTPCTNEVLKTWPVSRAVGNVKNNTPDLIMPL